MPKTAIPLPKMILEVNKKFFQVFLNAGLTLTQHNVKLCWIMLWDHLAREKMAARNLTDMILGKYSHLKSTKKRKSDVKNIFTQIYEAVGVLLTNEIEIENETGNVPDEIMTTAKVLRLWIIRELNLILILLASIYAQKNGKMVGVSAYNLSNFDPENLLKQYGL